jgi:hypothetical protein
VQGPETARQYQNSHVCLGDIGDAFYLVLKSGSDESSEKGSGCRQ